MLCYLIQEFNGVFIMSNWQTLLGKVKCRRKYGNASQPKKSQSLCLASESWGGQIDIFIRLSVLEINLKIFFLKNSTHRLHWSHQIWFCLSLHDHNLWGFSIRRLSLRRNLKPSWRPEKKWISMYHHNVTKHLNSKIYWSALLVINPTAIYTSSKKRSDIYLPVGRVWSYNNNCRQGGPPFTQPLTTQLKGAIINLTSENGA